MFAEMLLTPRGLLSWLHPCVSTSRDLQIFLQSCVVLSEVGGGAWLHILPQFWSKFPKNRPNVWQPLSFKDNKTRCHFRVCVSVVVFCFLCSGEPISSHFLHLNLSLEPMNFTLFFVLLFPPLSFHIHTRSNHFTGRTRGNSSITGPCLHLTPKPNQ